MKVTEKDDMETTLKVVEYTYDVFDRRIGKALDTTSPFTMTDAVIERYIIDHLSGTASIDGGNVVLDFVDADGDGSGTMDLERRYLYGNAVDQILAQENIDETTSSADRVYWHLTDHLGTVRDLAKNDGTIAEHYEYESFGAVIAGDTSLTRNLFTSREWDEDIDLQYNRARWYDPAVGRWISQDPIGFAAGDTNVSRYVGNGVTGAVDPSGLVDQDAFWDGAVLAAKGLGLPAFLVGWAEDNDLSVNETTGGPRYFRFWNSIEIGALECARCARIGRAGRFTLRTDRVAFGAVYNELFHAWFDQSLENNKLKSAWLWDIMRSQDQFGADELTKTEEAMSELIGNIINNYGRPIPTYDELMADPKLQDWAKPGHNEEDQDWHGDVGAEEVMTEELYYATLWILDNGYQNPLAHRRPFRVGVDSPLVAGLNDGDVLAALRQHFIRRYRPTWTPGQISAFVRASPQRTSRN